MTFQFLRISNVVGDNKFHILISPLILKRLQSKINVDFEVKIVEEVKKVLFSGLKTYMLGKIRHCTTTLILEVG